jgi:hypothetical protein
VISDPGVTHVDAAAEVDDGTGALGKEAHRHRDDGDDDRNKGKQRKQMARHSFLCVDVK